MKRFSIAAAALFAAGLAQAQPATAQPAAPAGPAPTGLIVGSGNFFSPIVADLDKALAFYRDGLGFETTEPRRGRPAPALLMSMFGLPPEAKLRWTRSRGRRRRARVSRSSRFGRRRQAARPQLQDPGAFMLIVLVRDIDAALGEGQGGRCARPHSRREAMTVPGGAHPARMAVVKDPDGHFVELAQLDPAPETQAPARRT